MLNTNRNVLFAIVRAAVSATSRSFVEETILKAHNGRPTAFVNMGNQHLFRQYRNAVSGDASRLVDEALVAKELPADRTELGQALFQAAATTLESGQDTFNKRAYMIGALMALAELNADDMSELLRIMDKF